MKLRAETVLTKVKREHFEAPTLDTNVMIGVKLNYKNLPCKVITEVRGSDGSR